RSYCDAVPERLSSPGAVQVSETLLKVTVWAGANLGRSAIPAQARTSATVGRIGSSSCPPRLGSQATAGESSRFHSRCSAWRRTWGDAGLPQGRARLRFREG